MMKYHYIPVRIAEVKNSDNVKCWQGSGATWTYTCCWQKYRMLQLLWKIVCQFHIKLSVNLQYDPTILFLGINSRDMKTYVYTMTCMWIFIAVLYIIARNYKESKYSSGDEQTIYTMVYPYSGLLLHNKRSKLL